ncbi:MAG: hypothetical protein H7A33_03100 [Deltaproteobacteria bacterium]|nr:hypothetical protein [Deltaproteobacteria bacterium]
MKQHQKKPTSKLAAKKSKIMKIIEEFSGDLTNLHLQVAEFELQDRELVLDLVTIKHPIDSILVKWAASRVHS